MWALLGLLTVRKSETSVFKTIKTKQLNPVFSKVENYSMKIPKAQTRERVVAAIQVHI